jgi:hypothetical protein
MKIFKFDADASWFEKFVTYFAAFGCSAWVLFVFLSIWGVIGGNAFSANADKASAGMHTLGFVMFLVFVCSLVAIRFDAIPFRLSNMGKVALVAASLLLSIAFYSGFWVAI